jgi:gamma-aminobutyric acid type B receptor
MRLRYYFQLLAEEVGMARGFLGLIRRFGWRRVGIITQNENLFTATMDALKKSLSEYGIDYLEKVFTTSESIGGLRPNPFEPHIRIYVFAMYSLHARALICEAYKRGIVYPKYQLLVYGWYSVGWWRESDSARLDCSQDQLNSVLPHAMGPIQAEFYSNLSLVTEGGLTAAEFEKLYYSKISSPQNQEIDLTNFVSPSSRVFSYAQQCHEATLALAMALHNTSTELQENISLSAAASQLTGGSGQAFTLDQFDYPNSVVVERMFDHLTNTNFLGISGNPVRFDANGLREITSLIIYHYFPPEAGRGEPQVRDVGEVTDTRDPQQGDLFYYGSSFTESLLWPDGIPNDGIPVEEVVTVSRGLTVVYIILAFAGIVFAVACLLFNLVFRQRVLIRMSSPNLNYVIGLGAIVLYFNVVVLVIPTTEEKKALFFCNLSPWLTAIGYSLCYGTIVVKMMRVWYIFSNSKITTKYKFHDWMLALSVLALVVIDIIIIGVYMLVEGIQDQLMVERVLNRDYPEEVTGPTAEVHEFYVYICHTQSQSIYFGIL